MSLNIHLREAAEFISPHIEFLNTHNVDFLIETHWKTRMQPQLLADFLEIIRERSRKPFCLNQQIPRLGRIGMLIEQIKRHLGQLESHIVGPQELIEQLGGGEIEIVDDHSNNLKMFMSPKKSHEVLRMSALIKSIYDLSKANCVIDVGSGKGYLDTHLAYGFNLPVIGIEGRDAVSESAQDRKRRLMWQLTKLRTNPELLRVGHVINGVQHVTCRISNENDLDHSCPVFANVQSGVLCGLHACGQLSVSLLKAFVLNDRICGCVVAPCCYQHLEERNWQSPLMTDSDVPKGFPLSAGLCGFWLGRDARSLSCRAFDEMTADPAQINEQSKRMWYRIVLEFVLVEIMGIRLVRENSHFGRRLMNRANLTRFSVYCSRVLDKIGVAQELRLTNEFLDDLYEQSLGEHRVAFFTYLQLKLSFSRLIELILLLDWLDYLNAQKQTRAFCCSLFDPKRSPRNHAIVAVKQTK